MTLETTETDDQKKAVPDTYVKQTKSCYERWHYYVLASVLGAAFLLVLVTYYGFYCRGKMPNVDAKTQHNMWFFSHVGLYAILGYMFPKEWKLLFGIGIVWEGIEWGVRRWGESVSHKSCPSQKLLYCKRANKPVLYESWKDIIANLIGIGLGAGTRQFVKL
jgi:hypothetical protein